MILFGSQAPTATHLLDPSFTLTGATINAQTAGTISGEQAKTGAPNVETGDDFKPNTDKTEVNKILSERAEQKPTIEITDGKNEEYSINTKGILDLMRESQQAQWEREDAIRKETQEREDTAYQRAVEDMRKAGINPNLVGVNPAASGGGITSATGQATDLFNSVLGAQTQEYTTEVNKLLQEWKTEVEKDTEISENAKNRWSEYGERLLQGAMNIAALFLMSKFKK